MSIVRPPETISVRSSVTDGDLEEARQRLLDHMEVSGEDPGKCGDGGVCVLISIAYICIVLHSSTYTLHQSS